MKLLSGPTSPFARKCRIVAIEKAITLEEVITNPFESKDLPILNPLRMIPVLLLEDGKKIYDSDIICRYLDALGSGPQIYPGGDDWSCLTFATLGNRLADASVQLQLQKVLPEGDQSQPFMEKMKNRIERSFSALDSNLNEFNTDALRIDSICIISGIGHIELRHGDEWRGAYPALTNWYLSQMNRNSIIDTAPSL